MVRTTVGILRGGTSNEYEHSLKSGAALMAALPEDKYDTRDIFVDTHGMWHRRGMPADPARALAQLDVVLNVFRERKECTFRLQMPERNVNITRRLVINPHPTIIQSCDGELRWLYGDKDSMASRVLPTGNIQYDRVRARVRKVM